MVHRLWILAYDKLYNIRSVLLLNAGSLRKPPGLYVFHLASADSLLLLSLPFVRDFKLYLFTNDENV